MLLSLENYFSQLSAVQYAHWKSNSHLNAALNGDTDIDLLVSQQDAQHFRKITLEHGFKQMISPPEKQFPGLEDYLGFDPESGRLIHLHVHYRLVIGKQYAKNYHLPLEECLLDSHQILEGVKISSVEWELALLIVRALLKIKDRKFILSTIGLSSIIPEDIIIELGYLIPKIDSQKLKDVIDQSRRILPEKIIMDFLNIWEIGNLSTFDLFFLKRRLVQWIKKYQRYPRWQAALKIWIASVKRVFPWWQSYRKRMANGGLSIALIGPDGAGKTTYSEIIRRWLSWKLDVSPLYMGSKQPSWSTRLLSFFPKISGKLLSIVSTIMSSDENVFVRFFRMIDQSIISIFAVALARDRSRRFHIGCQIANQGRIVLYDRFPLKEIYYAMDGPRIDPKWKGVRGKLGNIERKYFGEITLPDYSIILHVDVNEAMKRKPNHNLEIIKLKCEAVQTLKRQANPSYLHVNTVDDFLYVEKEIKQIIWDLL